jgi:hypothetical protein
MKKYGIALLTSLATFAFAGPGQQDTAARLQAAGQVMNEIMAAPDKGIPEEVLHGAQTWGRVDSSSAASMGAVLLPAAPPTGGVRQHSFRLVEAILASRLAVSPSISSCCS